MATISRTVTCNRAVRAVAPGLALLFGLLASAEPARAFSQIMREDGSVRGRDDISSAPLPPLDPEGSGNAPDWGRAPMPGMTNERAGEAGADAPAGPGRNETPSVEAPAALPIRYGEDGLPTPVRDLRARLIEIARSGNVEALRPYLETGPNGTALSVVASEEDPIAFLKGASGDGEGVEILAILLDVLESGHVRLDEGTDSEIFVWPYFAQVDIEALTPAQLVELFQIVTAGDYQQMVEMGAYYFYRVGISPDGRLEFFLAGD